MWAPSLDRNVFPEIVRGENAAGNRVYKIKSLQYAIDYEFISATTFLSQISDDTWLDQWRMQVGAEEADRITHESGSFGTALHWGVEHHIKGKEYNEVMDYQHHYLLTELDGYGDRERLAMLTALCQAGSSQIYHYMNSQYTTVLGLEEMVFSERLKLAGTLDCLAISNDGHTTLVDFKNSRRLKLEKYIGNYFLQCFIYATCIKEMVRRFYQNGLPKATYEKLYQRLVPTHFEIICFNRADTSKYEVPGVQLFRGKLDDIKPEFVKAYTLWNMKHMSQPQFGKS